VAFKAKNNNGRALKSNADKNKRQNFPNIAKTAPLFTTDRQVDNSN
jgi:hypothetical protein